MSERPTIVKTVFPGGIPNLWCPLLTHYSDDGSLDRKRIAAHIAHMRPYLSAFLAPGSTGDGWEMEAPEQEALVDFLLEEAKRQKFMVMVGVLRTERGEAAEAVRAVLQHHGIRTDGVSLETLAEETAARRICGFTVTPPKGADLPQETILAELEATASIGAPLSIYQLPQITENEMTAATVALLEREYPNVYLLKDTSGVDRIVLERAVSPLSVEAAGNSLFFVRGAEGDYSRWYRSPYDGFLLSTANVFARELSQIMTFLDGGSPDQMDAADRLSRRVTAVVEDLFAAAAKLSFGNPFANANKAMDHHYAWGNRASSVPMPMTHSGNRLPEELVEYAERRLRDEGFDPGRGYVEG